MAIQMPTITKCSATECSYNKNNECHTLAITVGDASHPACDTFFKAGHKGGVPDAKGGVGACKSENCQYNVLLECSAKMINVGYHQGHADCTTFTAR